MDRNSDAGSYDSALRHHFGFSTLHRGPPSCHVNGGQRGGVFTRGVDGILDALACTSECAVDHAVRLVLCDDALGQHQAVDAALDGCCVNPRRGGFFVRKQRAPR